MVWQPHPEEASWPILLFLGGERWREDGKEEGDQRRLGIEELEAEPITLDRCIVTDLDWKPWSVVECFIKTSQHVSVLHSVAASGLHVGETTNVGKWLNSSCLVFHACLFFSSYKVGMLRLGDRFVTLLNEFMLLIKCQFCFIYLQYFVIGLVILLILLSVFICFFFFFLLVHLPCSQGRGEWLSSSYI